MRKDNTRGFYRKNMNQSPVIGWEIAGNRHFRGVEEKGIKWK
jgi:hypothetical protein